MSDINEVRAELAELLLAQNDSTRELAYLKTQIAARAKLITELSDRLDSLYTSTDEE